MGKIETFKNVKVVYAFKTPLLETIGKKPKRGKQIVFSFGHKESEAVKKVTKLVKEYDDSARDYVKSIGKKYTDLPFVIKTFDKSDGTPVDDLLWYFDLTKAFPEIINKVETGKYIECPNKDLEGIEPKILLKGEETEIDFPYSGDLCNLKVELKLVDTGKGHRFALILHEIDIIDKSNRPIRNTNKGYKEVDMSKLDKLFSKEDAPKKEVKKEVVKTEEKDPLDIFEE